MKNKGLRMHTVKLEIGDSVYSHIMFLLKNLNSTELKIIEENHELKEFDTTDVSETKMLSNHSATLIEDWNDPKEDDIWR